jgi:hypothetical protein
MLKQLQSLYHKLPEERGQGQDCVLVLRLILHKGVQRFHGKREREEKQKQLLTHTDSMLLSWKNPATKGPAS